MRAIALSQPCYPDWLSPGATAFITEALHKAPSQRSSVEQLLQHPWIGMHISK